MSERILPHDIPAEAAVVSASLMGAEDFERALAVLPTGEPFYVPAHRHIWDAALEIRSRGGAVDPVTVTSELRARSRLAEVGGTPYIGKLVNETPAVANIEAYARTVLDTYRVRRVIGTCQRIAAEGYGDFGDAATWIESAEASLFEVAREKSTTRVTCEWIGDVTRESMRKIIAGESPAGLRVTSGIRALDDVLSMHASDLVIVAARPGMGKSAIVAGIAANAALQETPEEALVSLIFSAEMGRDQIAQRLLCAKSRVPIGALRRGTMGHEDLARLVATHHELDVPLRIDDRSTPDLAHISATIRATNRAAAHDWKREDGKQMRVRLVVVDYVQIMGKCGERGANVNDEMAARTKGLKKIAKDEECVVIALSQLNRGVESRDNKRPTLSDLRDSGSIEQDADSVMFVYRDEYYDRNTRARGIAELLIGKQRNDEPNARAMVGFEGQFTLFRELTPSEQSQLAQEQQDEAPRSKSRWEGKRTG